MATQVTDYLSAQPGNQAFCPYSAISREADALTTYFKGEPDYSERLTDHVTLYRSLETQEIVGCRIKGISALLEDLPNFLQVKHDGVTLSMVFWSFCGGQSDDRVREAFGQLASAAGDMALPAGG